MIILTQNNLNNIITTVSEKDVSCSGSTYLFEFKNDTSGECSQVIVPDYSVNTMRYNQFSLLVTGSSANPLSGSINLSLPGFYQYTIYQGTGSINPTSSIGLNVVETGKMLLQPAISSSLFTNAFTSSYNPIVVFNPSDYGIN